MRIGSLRGLLARSSLPPDCWPRAPVAPAVPFTSCSKPPSARKLTHAVVSAIQCVVNESRQIRDDGIQDVKDAYPACTEEQKNTPPNWTVIDQTGESMIEFGQFTVPPLGEAEEAIATYLTRFERAYPSAHIGHMLTNAGV